MFALHGYYLERQSIVSSVLGLQKADRPVAAEHHLDRS